MSAHSGTHLDGPTHWNCGFGDGKKTLICDIPLMNIIGEGVIVDISDQMDDYYIYGPEDVMKTGADIRKGDIVIINTGCTSIRRMDRRKTRSVTSTSTPAPSPSSRIGAWICSSSPAPRTTP